MFNLYIKHIKHSLYIYLFTGNGFDELHEVQLECVLYHTSLYKFIPDFLNKHYIDFCFVNKY